MTTNITRKQSLVPVEAQAVHWPHITDAQHVHRIRRKDSHRFGLLLITLFIYFISSHAHIETCFYTSSQCGGEYIEFTV